MARKGGNFGPFRIFRRIFKKLKITKPNVASNATFEIVNQDVYNNWKLVIQLFLRIESFVVSNLRVPSESQLQLLQLSTLVGSQQIIDMVLGLGQNSDLLYDAVQHKQEDIVKIILENGTDANCLDHSYRVILYDCGLDDPDNLNQIMKPIQMASKTGSLRNVQLLIRHGANVNARGPLGWTAIHYAAGYTFPEIVKYLLKNGAEVNPKNDHKSMPIHLAAQAGCTSIIELLIEHGASPVAKGFQGMLPIHFAIYSGHMKAAQFLVQNGGNDHSADDTGFTPLDFAIKHNRENIFRLLFKNGATVRQDSIQMAITEHSGEMIMPLLGYGLDVNKNASLHEAMKCGCSRCIEVLKDCIKFGANIDMKDDEGKTSFECALSKGRLDVFKLLSI